MAKKISEELVIGNALISTNRKCLTRQQVHQYWHFVDLLLPEGYYTNDYNNSFEDFCEEYPFLVKRIGDIMMINCDNKKLVRYCRIGVPIEIIEVFDIAGIKLNEIESSKTNYNEGNIKSLEELGTSCDVTMTGESGKKIKVLLN